MRGGPSTERGSRARLLTARPFLRRPWWGSPLQGGSLARHGEAPYRKSGRFQDDGRFNSLRLVAENYEEALTWRPLNPGLAAQSHPGCLLYYKGTQNRKKGNGNHFATKPPPLKQSLGPQDLGKK